MYIKPLALLVSLLILNACDSDSNTTTSKDILSGTIIDEQMSNAKICIDSNSNMNCDPEEPYGMSDTNGNFEIIGSGFYALQVAPLVAEINSDTINELTGKNLGANIKLSAPAGCHKVSFLTTIAQYFVETGLTVDESLRKTENIVLSKHDICTDYSANTENIELSNITREENLYLSRLSKIKMNLFASNMHNLLSHESESFSTYLKRHRMLMAHAIDKLPVVIKEVANSFDTQQNEFTPLNLTPEYMRQASEREPTGTFIANQANIERVTLLDEIARSPNINVIDKFIPSTAQNAAIYRFTDAFSHNQFNLSYTQDRNTIGPQNNALPLQRYSGTTSFFNWNSNTGQFEKGKQFQPNFEIVDTASIEANYRYYGYIPEPRFRSSYYEGLFPVVLEGAFGELDKEQIRLLYQFSNGNYPENLDDGISVIIKAKEFDASSKSISGIIKLQSDLELWNRVIKTNARFEKNTSVLSLTLTAGKGVFSSTPRSFNKCNSNQEKQISCFQASVITPNITPRYDKLDTIEFSKNETVTSLNTLKQDSYKQYIPLMPVLLTSNGHYIVIVLSYDRRARFYKFDIASLENKEFDVVPNRGAKLTFRSIKDSSSAGVTYYDGRQYTSIAESNWQRKNILNKGDSVIDAYIVELPNEIRRIQPDLPKTLALYGNNEKLYFGELYQLGDVIEENRISVNDSGLNQVIEAIDMNSLNNLHKGQG